MLLPEIDDPWFEKLPIEFPPTVHKNHLSMYEQCFTLSCHSECINFIQFLLFLYFIFAYTLVHPYHTIDILICQFFFKTVISNITCFFYICGSFLIILYGTYFRNSTSPPLIRRHRFFTAIAPIRYCPCITCVQYV